MTLHLVPCHGRLLLAGIVFSALAACSSLRPASIPFPTFYSLDSVRGDEPVVATKLPAADAPTLIVDPPHAASGFDSQRIIYVREANKVEYFAHSEWVDTPARMLAPLLVASLQGSGAFHAVVLTPSVAEGDLRLVTEIVRLQQEFGPAPSRVRFTLRAYLVDNKSRHVIARREFDLATPAASEDPYGGVRAASRSVQKVLEDLTAFCIDAV